MSLPGLPWWLSGKASAHQYRRHGFNLKFERYPVKGNGNPLHCSCLGNPINGEVWQAAVHDVAKESDTLSYNNMPSLS